MTTDGWLFRLCVTRVVPIILDLYWEISTTMVEVFLITLTIVVIFKYLLQKCQE